MNEPEKKPEPQVKHVTPKPIAEPVFAFDEVGSGWDEGYFHSEACCTQQAATGLCICEGNTDANG